MTVSHTTTNAMMIIVIVLSDGSFMIIPGWVSRVGHPVLSHPSVALRTLQFDRRAVLDFAGPIPGR
jgi:hypothetical protein